jgi:hypothetical protein
VRNCALGRAIQYAAALRFFSNVSDYWIPRLHGV